MAQLVYHSLVLEVVLERMLAEVVILVETVVLA
jgi:hypothetical protein